MDIDFEETLKYKDCVSKYVSVKTIDKKTHVGWLKTIDPLTGNLILVTFSDDEMDSAGTILIIANACVSVDVLKEANEKMKELIRNLYACQAWPAKDESNRKERLIAWIKTNRLPVHEDNGSIVVCESVTIHPPFSAESCSSSNGRILTKIRSLVASLPAEEVFVKSEGTSDEVSIKTQATAETID